MSKPAEAKTTETEINYRKGQYVSTKTYTHSLGLSACFRQHKAESHCRFLHGYSLQVKVLFYAEELDVRNWVVDFGSLKSFKGWLEDTFDHKCLVAEDDPHLSTFRDLERLGMIQLRVVPATGCEAFARMVYEYLEGWLKDNGYSPRCGISWVEVREHEANSALYIPESSSINVNLKMKVAYDEASEVARVVQGSKEKEKDKGESASEFGSR